MLGVLKRRWKPKRSSSGGQRGSGGGSAGIPGDNCASVPSEIPTQEKQRSSLQSPRQVHPVSEEKAHLVAYENNRKSAPPTCALPSPPSPPYPLTPNICVEGGRIEFIKTPPESATSQPLRATPSPPPQLPQQVVTSVATSTVTAPPTGATTVTRAAQTQQSDDEEQEKGDIAKEILEARVEELERLLETERRGHGKARAAVQRLQRHLAQREACERDVERERRLRKETEEKLRESSAGAERRLASLNRDLRRMEDTVRTMLQYKTRNEQLKQEKTTLTVAYEGRIHQFQTTVTKLAQENEALRSQLALLHAAGGVPAELLNTGTAGDASLTTAALAAAGLAARLRAAEQHNATLSRDAELQRAQYERCLDDVANQVVRALLSQKGLREEISRLERKVKELEAQKAALAALLVPTAEAALHSPRREPSALLWLPIQRPTTLSLQVSPTMSSIPTNASRCTYRHNASTTNAPSSSASIPAAAPVAEEGSESPESGNRDEGYSTMSSDVQCEGQPPNSTLTDASSRRRCVLEDLKEEAADMLVPCSSRLMALRDDPDVLYIPLGIALGFGNPRHSFPPARDLLPFQHVMRSFSDSHLCLKFSPGPSSMLPISSTFSLSSTTSSSPSVLVFDANTPDKPPRLRRSKGTTLLTNVLQDYSTNVEDEDTESWSSALVEGSWWDADYVQHWLRLDESRSALQNQHRAEYDQAELEDWSMQDEHDNSWRRIPALEPPPITPGIVTLPAIHEHVTSLDLEEDSSECLWNNASYLEQEIEEKPNWPYGRGCELSCMISPGNSWSSEELCCSSKRSSAAMSGCSDEPEGPIVGTDFTRDFYRLVKFESTKSLASTSSICGGSDDREQALQNVLTFIAEQQQYCATREEDLSRTFPIVQVEIRDAPEPTSWPSQEAHATTSDFIIDPDSSPEEEKSHDVDDLDDNLEIPSLSSPPSSLSTTDENRDSIPIAENDRDNGSNRKETPQETREAEQNSINSCNSEEASSVPRCRVLVTVPEEEEPEFQAAMSGSMTSSTSTPDTVRPSLAFPERATSKDVIDELNRMIQQGEDASSSTNNATGASTDDISRLDFACCCPTGWVHVERDIDFTDPKARANLLDVMLASSGSSATASATSGSSSSSSESGDDPSDYHHLHRLHRFRRQKKASATRNVSAIGPAVLRCPSSQPRPSIIGRGDFFVRYGDKEREAVASFDFLDSAEVTTPLTPSSISSDSSTSGVPSASEAAVALHFHLSSATAATSVTCNSPNTVSTTTTT